MIDTRQSKKAQKILTALIQGVDPQTGEELPAGTVIQQAHVLRALLAGGGRTGTVDCARAAALATPRQCRAHLEPG